MADSGPSRPPRQTGSAHQLDGMRPRSPRPLGAALLQLLLAAFGCSFANQLPHTQIHIVCHEPKSQICRAWPLQLEDVPEAASKLHKLPLHYFCGLSDFKMTASQMEIVITSDTRGTRSLLCSSIMQLPMTNVYEWTPQHGVSRVRRQTVYAPRGRFRGQTQSQYLATDHGNGTNEGKAEAISAADTSKAIVSGRSGMGQAQSQSMYDPSCDECLDHYVPGPENLTQPSNTGGPTGSTGSVGRPIGPGGSPGDGSKWNVPGGSPGEGSSWNTPGEAPGVPGRRPIGPGGPGGGTNWNSPVGSPDDGTNWSYPGGSPEGPGERPIGVPGGLPGDGSNGNTSGGGPGGRPIGPGKGPGDGNIWNTGQSPGSSGGSPSDGSNWNSPGGAPGGSGGRPISPGGGPGGGTNWNAPGGSPGDGSYWNIPGRTPAGPGGRPIGPDRGPGGGNNWNSPGGPSVDGSNWNNPGGAPSGPGGRPIGPGGGSGGGTNWNAPGGSPGDGSSWNTPGSTPGGPGGRPTGPSGGPRGGNNWNIPGGSPGDGSNWNTPGGTPNGPGRSPIGPGGGPAGGYNWNMPRGSPGDSSSWNTPGGSGRGPLGPGGGSGGVNNWNTPGRSPVDGNNWNTPGGGPAAGPGSNGWNTASGTPNYLPPFGRDWPLITGGLPGVGQSPTYFCCVVSPNNQPQYIATGGTNPENTGYTGPTIFNLNPNNRKPDYNAISGSENPPANLNNAPPNVLNSGGTNGYIPNQGTGRYNSYTNTDGIRNNGLPSLQGPGGQNSYIPNQETGPQNGYTSSQGLGKGENGVPLSRPIPNGQNSYAPNIGGHNGYTSIQGPGSGVPSNHGPGGQNNYNQGGQNGYTSNHGPDGLNSYAPNQGTGRLNGYTSNQDPRNDGNSLHSNLGPNGQNNYNSNLNGQNGYISNQGLGEQNGYIPNQGTNGQNGYTSNQGSGNGLPSHLGPGEQNNYNPNVGGPNQYTSNQGLGGQNNYNPNLGGQSGYTSIDSPSGPNSIPTNLGTGGQNGYRSNQGPSNGIPTNQRQDGYTSYQGPGGDRQNGYATSQVPSGHIDYTPSLRPDSQNGYIPHQGVGGQNGYTYNQGPNGQNGYISNQGPGGQNTPSEHTGQNGLSSTNQVSGGNGPNGYSTNRGPSGQYGYNSNTGPDQKELNANGNIGPPENVIDPNSIASEMSTDNSQAESSISQNTNGTIASASSNGGNDKGRAKTQVSGTYAGSGTFSAQAEISDENKGAQSEVSGGKHGAVSNAQGYSQNSKSQANVNLGSETGSLTSNAQSDGKMHSSNTQVQGGVKGGSAEAQARGPGSTSSQAQIGFTPYKESDKSQHDLFKTPFVGSGKASSQSSGRIGESQSQLEGIFKYGIKYTGAAQAGSSLDKEAVFASRLPLSKIDVFDKNSININVDDTEKPLEVTPLPIPSNNSQNETEDSNEETEVKHESRAGHTHSDHHKASTENKGTPSNPPPVGGTRSFQSPITQTGSSADLDYTSDKEDNAQDDYDQDGGFGPEGPNNDGEQAEYNYDDFPKEPETHQSLHSPNRKSFEVKQSTGGNTQHIVLGSLNDQDAIITQRNTNLKPDESRIYQPGESVPGTGGYTIPIGFTGSVKSVASQQKTYALGSRVSPSQAQSVSLRPGTGKIKYVYPKSSPYSKFVAPKDLRSFSNNNKEDNNRYVSVSKTVTGALDSENNVRKQYSHTYYTKSSSCGYFTFTCTMVSGSNGRKKVCKPKIPTNPDGTPMRC